MERPRGNRIIRGKIRGTTETADNEKNTKGNKNKGNYKNILNCHERVSLLLNLSLGGYPTIQHGSSCKDRRSQQKRLPDLKESGRKRRKNRTKGGQSNLTESFRKKQRGLAEEDPHQRSGGQEAKQARTERGPEAGNKGNNVKRRSQQNAEARTGEIREIVKTNFFVPLTKKEIYKDGIN